MKTIYNIVDNVGDVYASDISNYTKALLTLGNIEENLKKELSEDEIKSLELEII